MGSATQHVTIRRDEPRTRMDDGRASRFPRCCVVGIAMTAGAGGNMSDQNKTITIAFYTKALLEGDVDEAFRAYGGPFYRQHNPRIEDGVEGVRKFVAWIRATHPDAHGEVKRV